MPADNPAPERIQIKHRTTDAVLFECELPVECLSMPPYMKLGWVAKRAIADNANLTNADLTYADLAGANLAGAYLAYANLAGAYLARANLTNADLAGADLAGTVGIVGAGHDPRGYEFFAVKQDDGWKVKAGCRWFTFPEAEAHWKNNLDASARVNLLRTLVSLRD